MTAFENGVDWYHPFSALHTLHHDPPKLTYSKGSQHHHAVSKWEYHLKCGWTAAVYTFSHEGVKHVFTEDVTDISE